MEDNTQYMTPEKKERYQALVKEGEAIMLKVTEALFDLRKAHANLNALKAYGRANGIAFKRTPSLAESWEWTFEYLDSELIRTGKVVTELYRRFDEIEERKLDLVVEGLDARR